MARPIPIRQAVIDVVRTQLATITKANGYLFDVGATRVHLRDVINATVTCPAVMVVQRGETVQWASINRHYERDLTFQIGFVAEYNGEDPDGEAVRFMAEIERALGFQHFIEVTDLDTGTVTARHPIAFYQTGNLINVGEPLEGRVFGQLDYTVNYFTSYLDPRQL